MPTLTDTPQILDEGQQARVFIPGHAPMLLDRDRLETACLLRLEHTNRVRLAVALRDEHGFVGDSIRYAIAADALHRAGIDF